MIHWFYELYVWQKIVVLYLIFINTMTIFYFGLDKISAQINKRRIREKTLLTLAGIGGSIGALIAMKIFRHKTRKNTFHLPLAIIIAIQLALLIFLFS
ncbi:MAG: DUF1294 domain-containing protein [Candidatus Magasanikbacteria bacterium]|uniref:DUF1294 domain-containing protein n=1 Tax=Candidatus Magasanikbacteria bacterium CG10_big_fil_rev_8_21_14_0_10_38_6 TaxID=1974647 RepID=A0A2M6P206_9BACT|nr:DUF1294 domain-containing protein [Candidatus Magasanikbacteria bacterium]NCS72082.1 DUF1294 domain-containing protein [Candidatus Magasanikbacteria bacterium]PIR77727.1 MAG: DUF1294 domain-containing protein [Candidatus Magasanikbacteria bacterium CG10_big_fil_rev_8_21_14_0_10_38_6]